jgi:hypothetical protein
MNKVIIRPNPRKKPLMRYERVLDREVDEHGRVIAENVTQEDNLTRAPGTNYRVCANLSSTTGLINTGLDKTVSNPYKDSKNLPPDWEAVFKDKDTVKLQSLLEYKHGREKGYYTNAPAGKDEVRAENIPFFQSREATFNLNDGITTLDLDKPLDEVKFYVAKSNSRIANSFEELTDQPFYISDKIKEEKRETGTRKLRNSAISKLETLSERNDDAIVKFCQVVGDPLGKVKNLNKEQAYTLLDTYIRDTKDSLSHFTAVFDMWNSQDTRIEFNARALASDLKEYRVIYKRGPQVTWQPPEQEGAIRDKITWDTYEEFITEFMANPKYQKEREEMKLQLEMKKKYAN